MAQFKYTAVTKENKQIQGMLDAPNEAEARVLLRAQHLRPVKISMAGALEWDVSKIFSFLGGSHEQDLVLFTRQLSILISSGIPLIQGLDIISAQMKNLEMKQVVLVIKEKVTGGSFLWEALRSYPSIFSNIYVHMVRAGESSGSLDAIFKRLIKYLDDYIRVKRMLKGAMVYPIAVISIGIAVIAVMMVFVIPKFEELLRSNGGELPAPTQWVIQASHFFQQNLLVLGAGGAFLLFILRKYFQTDEGRRFFDFTILKTPVFGALFLKIAVARFSRTMQTLLVSGVNLLDALDISRDVIGNMMMADQILRLKSEVEHGKTLGSIMSRMPQFPNMVVQMVTVGENTGNLDKMLERVSDFYEEEVESFIQNLSKLIEPLVLVVLGGLIGGLMIAMYLPVFQMAGPTGS